MTVSVRAVRDFQISLKNKKIHYGIFFAKRRAGTCGEEMTRRSGYLEALEAAILIRHKCRPIHRETVFVREETEQKETVWEGYVDAFDLAGHKGARTCYAWQHMDGKGGVKIFTVLQNQIIDSARRAVQAAIFVGAQPLHHLPSKDWERFKQHLGECKVEDLGGSIHAQTGIRENTQRGQNPEV